MTTLSVEGGFSVHDYRYGLKLLREDGETMTLSNREGFKCPACGEAFDRLLVAETESVSVSTPPDGPLCVVGTDEQLLVLTH